MSSRKGRGWRKQQRKALRAMNGKVVDFTPKEKTVKVTVHRDSPKKYPELWLRVFIAADNAYEHVLIREWLARAYCSETEVMEEADLVIFGGGSDVHPSLYNEKAHKMTRANLQRDHLDMALYTQALGLGVPMFGICRGAQFLHVMNGGRLFQHVNNHYGDHQMFDRQKKNIIYRVSSTHHQMCMANPSSDMVIIGDSHKVSTCREATDDTKFESEAFDIEAFYYPSTGCLGVQGHPEYRGYHEFAIWALQTIEDTFVVGTDFHRTVEDKLRIKDDVKAQRIDAVFKELN